MDASVNDDFPVANCVIKKEKINEDLKNYSSSFSGACANKFVTMIHYRPVAKEFAETAMNELLGWYGYGNPRDDTERLCRSRSGSNSSGSESPKYAENCGWCGKQVDENVGLSSGTSVFCSESCFSQSRRASFKKNKTCDWCRHVRHTVSYVDFQDGASQLQFCSDKCLNQYKMHLFCRETEAHLELHPHLHGDSKSSAGLITPELWLKNCKSPDSQTPPSPRCSPKLAENPPQTSPLPLITVAHPSKLMENNLEKKHKKMQKKQRKRIADSFSPFRPMMDVEGPQDLRIRHSPLEKSYGIPHAHRDAMGPLHVTTNDCLRNRFQNYPRMFLPDPRLLHSEHVNNQTIKKSPLDLPPVTVLVPYPIILPLPLPIPIPLPLSSFLTKEEKQVNGITNSSHNINENLEAENKATSHLQIPQPFSTQTVAPEPSSAQVENGHVEDAKVEKSIPTRPLRKRKKVVDAKNRVTNKKKPVSV